MRKLIAPLCVLATAGVGATVIAGCGAGEATGLDPAQAAAATAKKGTARVTFTTSVEGAGLPLPLSITGKGVSSLDSAKGRYTFDLAPLLSLAGVPKGTPGNLELLFDGGTIYAKPPAVKQLKIPGGKSWISLELPKIASALGLPTTGLGELFTLTPEAQLRALQSAKGLKKVGTEKVAGADTTHYRGTFKVADLIKSLPADKRAAVQQSLDRIEKLGGANSAASFGQPVPAELWVDKDGVTRKFLSETKLPSQGATPGGTIKQSYVLSDFGTPLDVTPPAAGDTFDATKALAPLLAQLAKGGGAPGGAAPTP